jgi:2'-deoxynucleoside 5'-phosphate N-hydrolase
MNIYFACSIIGGRQDEAVYQFVARKLLEWGHQVPSAVFALNSAEADENRMSAAEVYQRDVAWIEDCDLLIAEVSTPSHGVGYEIGYALQQGKAALCLHRHDSKISKMISGNPHPKLQIKKYKHQDQLEGILKAHLHRNHPSGE